MIEFYLKKKKGKIIINLGFCKKSILSNIISFRNGGSIMITAELTKKINLLPKESYSQVECFVEQLIEANNRKEQALKIFMNKMNLAEKSVQENGYYTEEEVEEELSRI